MSTRPPAGAAETAETDFGLLFALAFGSYVEHLHARLGERGFTGIRAAFGPVLRTLRAEPATLSGLARQLGVTKQALGRVVDDMREAGLVVQRPDPRDGRSRLLELSERGEAMVDAAIEIGRAFESELAAELGAPAIRALRDVLERLAARTGAAGEPASRRVRIL